MTQVERNADLIHGLNRFFSIFRQRQSWVCENAGAEGRRLVVAKLQHPDAEIAEELDTLGLPFEQSWTRTKEEPLRFLYRPREVVGVAERMHSQGRPRSLHHAIRRRHCLGTSFRRGIVRAMHARLETSRRLPPIGPIRKGGSSLRRRQAALVIAPTGRNIRALVSKSGGGLREGAST